MQPSARDDSDLPDELPSGGGCFIGRGDEIQFLTDAFGKALAGTPSLVMLAGDPGVGKTTLIRHVLPALRSEALVVSGHCYEASEAPYLPFAEAIRSALDQCPGALEALEEDEARLIQHFTRGEHSTEQMSDSPATDRQRGALSLCVSRLVTELARIRPVVLVIDDLHWADGASLELLLHLTFSASEVSVNQPVPVLIVCTYRPGDLSRQVGTAITRLEREPLTTKLDLTGLSSDDVREFIRHSRGVRPSQQLVSGLMEATSGNPLFLEEALAHLTSTGNLETVNGVLVSRLGPEEMQLPVDLIDTVRLRLERLTPESREVLLFAASLGDPFAVDELIVCFGDREAAVRALDEATLERLISAAGRTISFVHPLYRRALSDDVSPPRREEVHHRIAEALEGLYADSTESQTTRIANHLLRAGPLADSDKVVEYARAAAQNAFSLFAWGDASRLFAAAAERAREAGTFSERDIADLHFHAGLAAFRDVDAGPALEHLESAISGFRETNDPLGLLRAETLKARTLITIAGAPIGTMVDVAGLSAAIEVLGEAEPTLAGDALWALSQCYWHAGRHEQALEAVERAFSVSRRADDPRLLTECSSTRGLIRFSRLQLADAAADLREGIRIARTVEDQWALTHPFPRFCMALVALGELGEAWSAVNDACNACSRVSDWAEHSLALSYHVTRGHLEGNFAAAETAASRVVTSARRSGYIWGPAACLPTLARLRMASGSIEESEDALELLTQPGAIVDEPGLLLSILTSIYRALIAAECSDLERAKSLLQPVRAILAGKPRRDINSIAAYNAIARTGYLLNDHSLLATVEEPLDRAYDCGVVVGNTGGFVIPEVRGWVKTGLGRLDEAEACFSESLTFAERWKLRTVEGTSSLGMAEMLVKRDRRGDRALAARHVLRAAEAFEGIGMTHFLKRARSLGEALGAGIAPLTRPAVGAGDLSPREIEVLRLVAQGRTNQQIADFLVLSVKTVDRHVSNIFTKTGVSNRAGATAYAFEKQLVTG